MKEYCLGFAFDNIDGSTVLLINKLKPLWQKGKYNGIGGFVEPEEHPDDAMVREFREECGINTTVLDWKKFCIMKCSDEVIHCYKASINIFHYKSLTEEMVEIMPCDYVYRNHKVLSNIPWLIEMAKDSDLKQRVLEVRYT